MNKHLSFQALFNGPVGTWLSLVVGACGYHAPGILDSSRGLDGLYKRTRAHTCTHIYTGTNKSFYSVHVRRVKRRMGWTPAY